MSLYKHIKGLFSKPSEAWQEIREQKSSVAGLFAGFVLPLLILGAIAIFIGYGFTGIDSFMLKIKGVKWGIWFGLRYLISGVAGFFVSLMVIDVLAPLFNSEKNIQQSASLVAYASTPSWLAALVLVYPVLGILGLVGLYGVYLFYTGLPVMKKTPDDKRIVYMLLCSLIVIILSWIMQFITGSILSRFIGDPYAGTAEDLRQLFPD